MARPARHDLALVVLLVAAAAIRLLYLGEIAGTDLVKVHLLDAETYHEWASRLVAGDPGWYETYWMGPLYPHLVALVYLVFGVGGLAVPALQLLLTVVNAWLVHGLARTILRTGGQPGAADNAALLAAALYAFYGAPVFYAGFLLMATVTTTLMLLVAAAALRAQAEPTRRRWLVLGLLVGLSGLARGNTLLLTATLPFLLRGQPALTRRSVLGRAALFVAGVVVMIAPVTLRNVIVARDFALLTSNGGINLFIGQQPQSDGTFKAAIGEAQAEHDPSMEMVLEWELGRDLKGSETSRLLAGRAWRTFRDNLGAMPLLYLKKTWRFWSGYELPQIEAYVWYRREFTALKLLPVPYLALSALGLVGFFFLGPRARLVVGILVGTYFLSLLPFFPTSRYRQPIAPLLAIAAAAWICAVVGTRAGWDRTPPVGVRWRSVGAAAVLAVVLWPSLTALPWEKIVWQVKLHEAARAAKLGDLRTTLARSREAEDARPGLAETPYLTALSLEDLEAWPEAAAAIDLAAARAPWSRLVLYRRGRIAEKAGRDTDALAAYRRAMEASPEWAYPWLRTGLILRREGRLGEALDAMREAYRRSPGNRRIRANLGSLLAETGRLDEARAVLKDLVRDYPVYVNGWYNLALADLQAGDRAAAARAAGRAAALHNLDRGEREQVERLRAAIAAAE